MKVFATIAALFVLQVPAWAQTKVYVYAHMDQDFVDSRQLASSVKDIQGNLAKRKGVVLVESEQAANITLEVMAAGYVSAGTKSDTHTDRGVFGGINSTTNTSEVALPSITARIHVRGSDYQKDIGYTGQRLWRVIAGYIGDQLTAWIVANQAQLQKEVGR